MQKPKVGRPPKDINQDNFEKLCGIFCTRREVCTFFDVSEDTIERWCKKTYGVNFAVVYEQKKDNGRISLRRAMFQGALKGNVALLIWLSKQHLGMTDKAEETIKQEIKQEITYATEWGSKLPDEANS